MASDRSDDCATFFLVSPFPTATAATTCYLTKRFTRSSVEIIVKYFLNASEVAGLLNVDRATVTRWIKRGLIKGAVRPASTQQWRIPLRSYEALIRTKYEGRQL